MDYNPLNYVSDVHITLYSDSGSPFPWVWSFGCEPFFYVWALLTSWHSDSPGSCWTLFTLSVGKISHVSKEPSLFNGEMIPKNQDLWALGALIDTRCHCFKSLLWNIFRKYIILKNNFSASNSNPNTLDFFLLFPI